MLPVGLAHLDSELMKLFAFLQCDLCSCHCDCLYSGYNLILYKVTNLGRIRCHIHESILEPESLPTVDNSGKDSALECEDRLEYLDCDS